MEPTHCRPLLPQLRLDELLAGLQVRPAAVVKARDRVHAAQLPGLRAQILEVAEGAAIALGFAPELRMSGRLDDDLSADAGEHLLGGSMRIEPADGGGTELEWRVPLRHEGG